MTVKQLAIILLLASTSVHADGWNCRNHDLEVTCEASGCKVSESFTPIDVTLKGKVEMSVCAYSGCWTGKPDLLSDGDPVIVAMKGMWSSDTGGNPLFEDFVLSIDPKDSYAVIKGAGYAMPLKCDRVVEILLEDSNVESTDRTVESNHGTKIDSNGNNGFLISEIIEECPNRGGVERPADKYIAYPENNIIVRIGGKFTKKEKLLDTFKLDRIVDGSRSVKDLKDIMYRANWNGNGSVGYMWLSGPENVITSFVLEQIKGYKDRTIYYDFGCEILNMEPGDKG